MQNREVLREHRSSVLDSVVEWGQIFFPLPSKVVRSPIGVQQYLRHGAVAATKIESSIVRSGEKNGLHPMKRSEPLRYSPPPQVLYRNNTGEKKYGEKKCNEYLPTIVHLPEDPQEPELVYAERDRETFAKATVLTDDDETPSPHHHGKNQSPLANLPMPEAHLCDDSYRGTSEGNGCRAMGQLHQDPKKETIQSPDAATATPLPLTNNHHMTSNQAEVSRELQHNTLFGGGVDMIDNKPLETSIQTKGNEVAVSMEIDERKPLEIPTNASKKKKNKKGKKRKTNVKKEAFRRGMSSKHKHKNPRKRGGARNKQRILAASATATTTFWVKIPGHIRPGEPFYETLGGWKMKIICPQNASEIAVDVPARNDILKGQSRSVQNHPGNIKLRKLAEDHYERYDAIYQEYIKLKNSVTMKSKRAAVDKRWKTEISNFYLSIEDILVKNHGRKFWRREEKSEAWLEISDEKEIHEIVASKFKNITKKIQREENKKARTETKEAPTAPAKRRKTKKNEIHEKKPECNVKIDKPALKPVPSKQIFPGSETRAIAVQPVVGNGGAVAAKSCDGMETCMGELFVPLNAAQVVEMNDFMLLAFDTFEPYPEKKTGGTRDALYSDSSHA